MAEQAKVYALNEEEKIRQKINDLFDSIRAKNLDGILSVYSPDIVAFDIIPPTRFQGIESYRKSWENGLNMMQAPISCENRDLKISVDGNVAFCHAINNMKFVSEGKQMDMWMRWTACFKKKDGEWLMTHEHLSVPIDMDTDKGIYELRS